MVQHYHHIFRKAITQRLIKAILIPTIIGCVIFAVAVPIVIITVMSNHAINFTNTVSRELDNQLNDYLVSLDDLAKNENIVEFLNGKDNILSVNQAIYQASEGQEYKAMCFMYSPSIETNFDSNRSIFSLPDNLLRAKIKAQLTNTTESNFYIFNHITRAEGNSDSAIAIAERVNDGYIGFIFDQEFFDLVSGNNDYSFAVVDEHDNIIYLSNNNLKTKLTKLKSSNEFWLFNKNGNKDYAVFSRELNDAPMKIVTYVSIDTLASIMTSIMFMAIIIILIEYILIRNIGVKLALSTMKPLDEMMIAMDHFDTGDTSYRLSVTDKDFKPFVEAFDNVLDHMDTLIKNNTELVIRTRSAELKSLQEQFKPHFVFNMLATVNYEIDENPEVAHSIIMALSRILRYLQNDDNKVMVLVKDDLKYIKDYLMLQKIRFGDNFVYTLDIEEDCLQYLTPKLLTQPAIENSIKHGYTGEQIFTMNIKYFHDGKDLVCIISDNGVGIAPDKLNILKKKLNSKNLNSKTSEHLGLLNIKRRLIAMGCDSRCLKIESIVNVGTVVTIRIKTGKR